MCLAGSVGPLFEEQSLWDFELVEVFPESFQDTHECQEVLLRVELEVGSVELHEGVMPLEVALLAIAHKSFDVPAVLGTLCLLTFSIVNFLFTLLE